MNVIKFLYVQAGSSSLVLAELLQHVWIAFEAAHQIQGQILLARGESAKEPLAFCSAVVLVVEASKADDAGAPHHRLAFGNRFHDLQHAKAIPACLLILDAAENLLDA